MQLMRLAVTTLAFSAMSAFAHAQPTNLQGTQASLAQTAKLIEAVGGADVWSESRSFMVRERAFLTNGETAELVIQRNLDDVTRWIRLESETYEYEEVIEREFGWRGRDGNFDSYTTQELDDERIGLEQSPYYIYHRLAKGDPELRVDWIEDDRRLNIFEGEERLLCWFFLDARGHPISWANIYKGRENRHNYGPLIDFGDANFPKWGASMDASWRFEYLEADFSDEPVAFPGLQSR